MARPTIGLAGYLGLAGKGVPLTLTDFGADLSVSTLQVLQAFTDYANYDRLFFVLYNTGPNAANLIIESSEKGIGPDTRKQSIPCPAGVECSLEVGPEQIRRYYRLSAQTNSPAFPATTVQWAVVGVLR